MDASATLLAREPGLAEPAHRAARVSVLGVPLDAYTMDQTVARVRAAMAGGSRVRHVCLNVAKLVAMRHDPELRADVLASDHIGADGMGVVFAARLLGVAVPERVAGVDLMARVIEVCARDGRRPYILGARPAVLAAALEVLRARHPGLEVAGARDGYFGEAEEPGIVAAIRAARPDCLFVAMPTPSKERFLARHAEALGLPFVMGVGGSVDVIAGVVDRAPRWMQEAGLEWLHRTLREPRRMWRRYLTTNAAFAGIMARELALRAFGARERRVASAQVPSIAS